MYDTELLDPGTAGVLHIKEPEGFKDCLRKAYTAWDEVCDLPTERLEAFRYEGDGKRSGVGFEVKDGSSSSDRKLDMHLTLKRQPEQLAQAKEVDPSGAFTRFILVIGELFHVMEPAVLEFAKQKSQEIGEPNYPDLVLAAKDEWMARGLCYPPGVAPGDILAAAHCDKGEFTADLPGNHGQMEYAVSAYPVTWRPLPKHPGCIPFMPGISLQARSGSRLIGVGHRVRSTAGSYRHGRKVIVLFIDSRGTYYFDKKRFGSQQEVWERNPGWNYPQGDLNSFHREFLGYFVR